MTEMTEPKPGEVWHGAVFCANRYLALGVDSDGIPIWMRIGQHQVTSDYEEPPPWKTFSAKPLWESTTMHRESRCPNRRRAK